MGGDRQFRPGREWRVSERGEKKAARSHPRGAEGGPPKNNDGGVCARVVSYMPPSRPFLMDAITDGEREAHMAHYRVHKKNVKFLK